MNTMPPEPATTPTVISLEVGPYARHYRLYRTNAPQRYDYSYVLTLVEDDGTRWILIPQGSADYQIGRYHSGLFWTVPSADFDKETVAERLWKAITDTFTDPGAE